MESQQPHIVIKRLELLDEMRESMIANYTPPNLMKKCDFGGKRNNFPPKSSLQKCVQVAPQKA